MRLYRDDAVVLRLRRLGEADRVVTLPCRRYGRVRAVARVRRTTSRFADGGRGPGLVLDVFLIRSMAMAGWEPVLAECARCGEPGPHPAFSVPVGGAVCATCRPAGAVTP
ncbi:MAG TPA: recombination protein O N-terminal domain-containing protein, partial [Mycobacteriales bacterium]|nr:recombination protein O N-terminal domain-containing protein [Mycobacteriales bacterium]